MNTLTAIETRYKGYRFRSRLEARWAVFWDLAGFQWSYENDPVNVDGDNYLPDFRVQIGDISLIHEVKPDNEWTRIQQPTVYLAGKMRPEHDWRGDASTLAREGRGVNLDPSELSHNPGHAWIKRRHHATMAGVPFNLIGPFPCGDDHGCTHAPESLHMAQGCEWTPTRFILAACQGAIGRADIICAHFSTADAYGTLVEIGLASGWRKKISVSVDKSLSEELCRKHFNHCEVAQHDLWFPCEIADEQATVDGYEEAQEFHAAFIRRHTPKEYRTISGIGMATQAAAMTFGDPLHVLENRTAHQWGLDIPVMCAGFLRSAQAARAHRFGT